MHDNVPEILSIRNIFNFEYVIPLYQRNFAWQGEQIDQLLRDVYNAWKKNPELNYYLGTLVLKHRYEHNVSKLEVIDGQQRLTVLTLIKRVFDSDVTHTDFKNCLFYDSRQEIMNYLSTINVHIDNRYSQSVKSLVDGEKTVRQFLFEKNDGLDLFHNSAERQEFARFFFDKVKLVCVHIPEDTDVAAYFEIMNNRGEQLQDHELLKSRLLNTIDDEKKRYEFASIWDACSQMDSYIQTRFEPNARKSYFGEDLKSFKFEGLGLLSDDLYKDKTTELKSESIYDILSNDKYFQSKSDNSNNDNDFANEAAHNSIIDFPNFLIHVLCAYRFNGDVKSCPLDSKFLLDNFADEMISQPGFSEDFIFHLFYARVCFDCFIIKHKSDESKEGGFSWSLKRPFKNDNDSQYLLDTFNNLHQERIIKVQSMLQVSVNTKNYKNWLQKLVLFFKNKECANIDDISNFINGEEYIKAMDSFVENQYEQLNINLISYSDGTRTPRFLFNFIDYLYWVAWSRIKANNNENTLPCLTEMNKKQIVNLNNFQFKYWNSVEHHLSQEKAKLKKLESVVDSLGNLCLTSRGTNSTLSNRDVLEKIQYRSSNMGMNRQIIYRCTESHKRWEKSEIDSHFIDLSNLLGNRDAILALD